MDKIGKFLVPEDFAKRFKITIKHTLFPIDWGVIHRGGCPICTHKLRRMAKNPKMLFCPSKKHRPGFVISQAKLDLIKKTLCK